MRVNSLPTAILVSIACLTASVHAGPKVGLVLKAQSVPFWVAVESGAKEAAQQIGAELTVKSPLSESDVGVQIRLLNALAAQGAEAIVISPINKEALAVPIASIAVKGVKIVIIDTPLTGNPAPFIGTNQEEAGKAGGQLLAKLVSDSDEVDLFKHSQASGATMQRDAGAVAAFRAAHPSAVMHGEIYASSDVGQEEEKARLVLKQHPNIKAVLATGTQGTLAMLKVLEEQKLAGKIKLVGFGFNLRPDVASALESGAMSGWIAQLPKEIGAKGINAAVSLLKGESVPSVVYTDFIVVTKENLSDPKVQALLKM